MAFAVLGFWGSSWEVAEASQFSRCATYLMAARRFHYVSGFSEESTRAALREAHLFRARNLNQFDYSGSNKPVAGSNRSRASIHHAITGRLSGVMLDNSTDIPLGEVTGLPSQEKFYGTVWSGNELIEAEIGIRRAARELANKPGHLLLPLQISLNASAVFFTLMGASPFLDGSAANAPAVPAVLGTSVALATAIGFRILPEVLIRMTSLWQLSAHDDVRLESSIARMQPGQWQFNSFDIRVPLPLVREMWNSQEMGENQFNQFLAHLMIPRSTYRRTTSRFVIPMWDVPKAEDDGWLRVDELLYADPVSGEPKLITFVRITEQLPIYPKTATSRSRESRIGVLEPSPSPIPVRR